MLFSYNKYAFLMNFIHCIKTSVTSRKTGAILCISIGVFMQNTHNISYFREKIPFQRRFIFPLKGYFSLFQNNCRRNPFRQGLYIRSINPHKQMESSFAYWQPVGNILWSLLRENNIHRAICIGLEAGTIIDAIAIERIIYEEIILTIGCY